VSGPGGTTIPGGSLPTYTYQAGDSDYETNSTGTIKAGQGYWQYFTSATNYTVPATTGGSVQITLPAGSPVMIGNPGSTTASVSGADSIMVYNSSTSSYQQATSLSPGQGAWATSSSGGTATITNPSS
jgi:hypothetical protein